MSSTDHNTPAAKSGRRSRKAAPRNPKPPPAAQADQLEPTEQPIAAAATIADTVPAEATAAAEAPIEAAAETVPAEAAAAEQAAPSEAAAAMDTAPMEAAAPTDISPSKDETASEDETATAEAPAVSLRDIAKAYGDYTRQSFEETRSYVEKLRDARSLDKAVEVQTEFTRHAFEMFVAGSRTIYGLHKELAKQALERLVNKPPRGQS